MNFRRITSALLLVAVLTAARGQVVYLNQVIGPSGTNAASVDGVGNPVNYTGVALNLGLTALTAPGSPVVPAFDFNTGFADSVDRTTGSTAGAYNVWADLKYDSSSTFPLILDTNNNGSFGDETALTGFGMHSDTFITFDLDVIRANAGIAPGTALILTGGAGIANTSLSPTSGAILGDGVVLQVFDWDGPTSTYSTYNLTIDGSVRYLTFAGLSGSDANNFYAHVGWSSVQLQAIPEPSVVALFSLGLAAGLLARRRRG